MIYIYIAIAIDTPEVIQHWSFHGSKC